MSLSFCSGIPLNTLLLFVIISVLQHKRTKILVMQLFQ